MMMKDVIAEPYREALLPNFAEVKQATRDLGALATVFQALAQRFSPLHLIYKPQQNWRLI